MLLKKALLFSDYLITGNEIKMIAISFTSLVDPLFHALHGIYCAVLSRVINKRPGFF